MSDTNSGAPDDAIPALNAENAPRIAIVSQFVKDLSFENPNSPAALHASKTQPNINLSVDLKARRLTDPNYQVDLHINITAKLAEAQIFLVELVYSGIFQLFNIPAENLQPVLLIECPRLIFPFARRIVADVTRDGGFAPLMMEPIDFASLYRQQMNIAQAKAKAAGTPPIPTVN